MKIRNLYYLILPAILFGFGCSKKIGVEAPSLDIKVTNGQLIGDEINFKLGETVNFAFSGTAGNIAVYTGDVGHNYAFKDRTQVTGGIPQLSFTSLIQWGNQTNTLQVLATNSLPSLSAEKVLAANWTNITSRVNLSTGAAVSSGIVNLSDLIKSPSDSLLIAFKYTGQTGSTQRTWTITDYNVNVLLPEGIQNISNLSTDNAYWTKFNIAPSTASWVNTTSQLQVVGGTATAPDNVSWIISKPLYVNRVAPDVSFAIKNIGMASLTSYKYKYATPGKYTVTFVISNHSVDDQQVITKQFKINITP